ncbi:MAG: IS21 family transposase [Cyclobacteriaceae bacterium]
MSKIRKVILLYNQGRSKLFISEYLSLSRNTVDKYLTHSKLLGIDSDRLESMTDLELDVLFSGKKSMKLTPRLEQLYAYFPKADKQLKKPGVTKIGLWEKYKQQHPDGVQSTQFFEHYARWNKKVNPVMRMTHKAGDKMYVDYAGKTLELIDRQTGEVTPVQFFVAILGASQYTYAEATLTQGKEDFIGSLTRALEFYEGVPRAIVPDNLKSAVTKSDRYEPTVNETLLELATHYDTAILPARAYKPRDKSLVEGAVKILYRRIYTSLDGKCFYTLSDLNEAISDALRVHNSKKLTGRNYSRKELFEQVEIPELSPLPVNRFQLKSQRMATVLQNGHVLLSVDKHYYSVPFQFIKQKVKILFSKDIVEVYHKHTRIAIHSRNYKKHDYTTHSEHLASTHKFVTQWSAKRFIQWAESIDESVKEYISKVLEAKQHPEQAFKSCMGILSMVKKENIGKKRLSDACSHALRFGVYNYQVVKDILDRDLDKSFPLEEEQRLPEHLNIRGKDYYN